MWVKFSDGKRRLLVNLEKVAAIVDDGSGAALMVTPQGATFPLCQTFDEIAEIIDGAELEGDELEALDS